MRATRSFRSLRGLSLVFAVASATHAVVPAQSPQGFGNRVLLDESFATWTSPAGFAALVNFGGGLTSFTASNTCGDPAPGMSVTCAPPAGATAGRVLLSAATWNPASGCPDCPVTTVHLTLSHINVATAAPGQLVWPAIVQGGTLFVATPLAAFSASWALLDWPALPATAFLDVTGANAAGLTLGTTNPDFSCTAAALSFGFVVTVSSAVATTRTHCYDNFKVVLECPGQFTTYCTGCANCGILPPAIGYIPIPPLPTINSTLQITETGACPNLPTFLLLGFSSLNFNLAGFGFPLCTLCVSPDVALATTTNGIGFASVGVPIPNNEYLIGGIFYAQWLDFGPPPIGMSDAAKIVIGYP